MKLFRRINAILTANFNDLVDRFEDPPTMLRQAIREMEETIHSALKSAAEVVASEKLLARQIAAQETHAGTSQKQAEAALARGDEDAARAALVRKKEHETLGRVLTDQHDETHEAAERLKRQIAAMQIQLGEARRKFSALSARQSAAEARTRLATRFANQSSGSEAFSLFNRMASRIEAAEARAEAFGEISGFQSECDIASPNDAEIDAELTALRESAASRT
jgi:phage shock protein A